MSQSFWCTYPQILGAGGSGKSTLLQVIAGLVDKKSTTGKVGRRAAFADPACFALPRSFPVVTPALCILLKLLKGFCAFCPIMPKAPQTHKSCLGFAPGAVQRPGGGRVWREYLERRQVRRAGGPVRGPVVIRP